jgi:hypothetical protein
MWANWETVAWQNGLGHNERHIKKDKSWFYVRYSLWESFDEVLKYLENKDLTIKKAALDAFNCFEPYKRGKDRTTPLRCERFRCPAKMKW